MSGASPERHRLLERQIRKARDAGGALDVDRLLDLVGAAYAEQDESRRLNDHAARLMSAELNALYAKVRADAATEARATEERLYGLLETIGDGVIVLDGAGSVLAFNEAAEAMFGRPRAAVIGQSFADLDMVLTDDAAGFVLAGAGDSGLEVQGRRCDGEVFTAEIAQARMSVDGACRVVTLWRDVTARKSAEEALLRARDEAHAASQAKSDFLAAMSHEIRTPLNGVLGVASALARTRLDANQTQMVDIMLESGELLTTILSDILDLSKIEAGRLELENAAFEPRRLLVNAAELFESTAAAKGLSLDLDLGAGLDIAALGDVGRLRQVVQNLLSNAIKFTAAGGVMLKARLAPAGPAAQACLTVEVLDSGCGVPEETRARLFTRFTQADSSTTRRFGGTGLGLALCRELVGAMGGDIGMRPRDEGGSCFWLTVPLQRAQCGKAGLGVAPASREGPAPVGALRILAVDDNATNRFVLKAILEAAGCVVALAEDGEAGVRAAALDAFDAILMDIHMPVLDGLGATHAIRAARGCNLHTPIIAVTAEALPEQVERARAAGMDWHVTKPIQPDRLFEVLSEAIAAGPIPARPTALSA
jgi:PAS domain S-box-containing protein